jgi:hypothetical protein
MKRAFFMLLGFMAGSAFLLARTPQNPETRKAEASKNGKRADAVVARWIQSIGGVKGLNKLQTVHTDERVGDKGHALSMILSADETLDGRYHFDLTGGGSLRGGYDGKNGWYESQTLGFGFVPPNDFHAWIWRSTALVARDLRASYPKIEYTGSAPVGKMTCDVLTMERVDGVAEKWFLDSKGHLLQIVRPARPGYPEMRVTFGDFRKVGSVVEPFSIVVANGSSVTQAERFSVDLNRSANDEYGPPEKDLAEYDKTEAILNRYRDAVGGKIAIDAVHSRVATSVMEMSSSGVATRTTLSQKEPNFFLREDHSPGLGTSFTGFDGTVGWVNSEVQGFRHLKPEEIAQWKSRSKIEGELDLSPQYPLRKYAGQREIDHRRTDALALATMQAVDGTFYFDAETGYLVRVEAEIDTGKTRVPAVMDLSDYRAVGALKMPFKTVWHTPTNTITTTYESMVFNVPLSDDLFKERRDD